jgi:hypothetical protein
VDESVNGPYYKYQISDSLELCIYSDEDGAFLLTKTPLLLKLSGVDAFCGLTSYNFGNLIVNNDERQDVKWRIVNKTAESIGMTEEEIASRGATHREEFSNTILYTDEATQTEYYMDGGICYMVNIPMSAAFLIWKGRDVITEEEFREYFTVPVKWSDYHFMSWSITFDDFMIYFPTDADRNVYGNSLISIRLRS